MTKIYQKWWKITKNYKMAGGATLIISSEAVDWKNCLDTMILLIPVLFPCKCDVCIHICAVHSCISGVLNVWKSVEIRIWTIYVQKKLYFLKKILEKNIVWIFAKLKIHDSYILEKNNEKEIYMTPILK